MKSLKGIVLSFPFVRNFMDDRMVVNELAAYIPLLQPSAILDLGAHKGFATSFFARRYPQISVHAYECNPRLFRILKFRAANLPNVKCFPEAIASVDGLHQFFVSRRNLSSSLYPVDGRQITVPSITLETAISRIGGNDILIKCDIEGAEYDVLNNISPKVREVIGEAHPAKANRSNDELRSQLEASGFRVSINSIGKGIFRAVRL